MQAKEMCRIELRNLDKVYTTGKVEYQALKDIDLTMRGGQVTAIVGPSGSGKSTFLNMITGIDRFFDEYRSVPEGCGGL